MENYKQENKSGIAWELVLPVGEENAISAVELCGRLGFSNTRVLRSAVMDARLHGVPICSLAKSEKSGGGYFLPNTDEPGVMAEEISHYVGEMRARAYSSLKQASLIEKWQAEQLGKENRFEQLSISEFLAEEERRAVV